MEGPSPRGRWRQRGEACRGPRRWRKLGEAEEAEAALCSANDRRVDRANMLMSKHHHSSFSLPPLIP